MPAANKLHPLNGRPREILFMGFSSDAGTTEAEAVDEFCGVSGTKRFRKLAPRSLSFGLLFILTWTCRLRSTFAILLVKWFVVSFPFFTKLMPYLELLERVGFLFSTSAASAEPRDDVRGLLNVARRRAAPALLLLRRTMLSLTSSSSRRHAGRSLHPKSLSIVISASCAIRPRTWA